MKTTKEFVEYNLQPELIKALNSHGFKEASEIQDLTIKPILEKKDIFALAETGSGKTGSFAIPIMEILLEEKALDNPSQQIVILSPTRELAQQTNKFFEQVGAELGIKSSCIIGGEKIEKQIEELKEGVHVLVATPGRLNDLTKQKEIDLANCLAVVFDEADRLFDMGFKKDIEFILNGIPKTRQLIMVSATTNMDVLNTAFKFGSQPLEIKLNEESILVDNIDHKIAMIDKNEKMPLLVKQLQTHEDAYAIIFCNTQFQTHLVAEWLKKMNFKAKPISGRMPQNKRTRLMEEFRSKETTILVCTDVAARGLDIKDVNLVINFDLPNEAASYVHRIGRTGRAGKDGQAISFCSFEDCENLDPISEFIGGSIPKMDLGDEDFATDVCPKPYLDAKSLQVVERPSRDSKKTSKSKDTKKPASKEVKPRTSTIPFIGKVFKNDRRFFISTASSEKESIAAALKYFAVKDSHLINTELVKEGRKLFFFFGPRKNTYKHSLKPIFKKVLTPFLIGILRKAQLDLFVKVSFKDDHLKVTYTGNDLGLLLRNKAELLISFETLIKQFLLRKVHMKNEVKLTLRCFNEDNQNDRPKNKSNEKEILSLVDEMKKKVLESKKAILLKSMNPAQRRIVHQYISEDPKFKSNSIGEGRFKQVELSLN
ncbi:putative ATP-dependent RNA helicase [Halobacteriovorax marinus SJ]|uniref:ATP-dependent RNA helicase n=1 Tax=Halobacteriovorax marinus (strain ATCC BAA-682 / DSM 15412 / SJ) TaxID=862908 RepID=E1WXP7_HALMS|nr:DEAD/DEAH box helicase [Halobacteriovorax marinus]CBW25853.1 putative ATP-dependent RNA helicase [Halobacteriovorax marinus SJ]